MTGYGSKSFEFPWGTVSFEIASVNSRFVDFSVKLPYKLSSLENRLTALLRKSITRGRIRLSADIVWNNETKIPALDEESLMSLYNQVRDIAEKNYLIIPNDITAFLNIPAIYEKSDDIIEQAALENPEIWDKIVLDLIDSMMEMKKSEGAKLKIKIEDDLNALETIMKSMSERWITAKTSALESIRTRIENVLEHFNLEIDEARIAAEVSLASDRWDISEEIARLESHIEKFRDIMNHQETSGKKLDFLIQEMNREVNTMGSKVADADFRWQVVEAKTCIEKLREQIQNVE